jgi:hypothetical protein
MKVKTNVKRDGLMGNYVKLKTDVKHKLQGDKFKVIDICGDFVGVTDGYEQICIYINHIVCVVS